MRPVVTYFSEISPVIQQEILNIDERLAKVHGPFSWDILNRMKPISAKRRGQMFETVIDSQDYFPEVVLIYYLMKIVEEITCNDLPSALESLITAEETLADIKERATMKKVQNVLQYIFIETKCHVMKKQGQLTKVVELLEDIIDVEDMNKMELAMLTGCHCSALSLYTTSTEEGIKYANKAIEYEPKNGKWHLLLARFHREKRKRDSHHGYQLPGKKEVSTFAKAYRLSPNVYAGVALAQMYRESKEFDKAEEIYEEVHAREPISWKIRLQLALGFIRTNNRKLAKECLDYVAEKMPGSTTYMHYMAIFEEKCNYDHKAALHYYKCVTKASNHSAEEQYMKCKKKVEPDWDPLPYLSNLPKKYKAYAHHVTQPMHIQIGLYYLYEKHNVIAACQYLTDAINMNPDNKRLRKQYPLFHEFGPVNVYHFLANQVEAALHNADTGYDEEEIEILNDTLQLCKANCNDLPSSAELSRAQTNWRKNYTKRSRGSSWFDNGYHYCSDGADDEFEDAVNLAGQNFDLSNETDYLSCRLRRRVAPKQSSSHSSSTFRDKKARNKGEAKSRRLEKTMKHLDLYVC